MTSDQLNALINRLATDQVLRDKLKAASDLEAMQTIVSAEGFNISADELKNYKPSAENREITEEMLESIAGGNASAKIHCDTQFPCATTDCA